MSSFDRVFLKVFPNENEAVSSLNVAESISTVDSNKKENGNFVLDESKSELFESIDKEKLNQSESVSEKFNSKEIEKPQTLFFEDYAQKRFHSFFNELNDSEALSNPNDSFDESTTKNSKENGFIQKIETNSTKVSFQNSAKISSDYRSEILKLTPQRETISPQENEMSAVIIPIHDNAFIASQQDFVLPTGKSKNNLEITLDNQDEIESQRINQPSNDYFLNNSNTNFQGDKFPSEGNVFSLEQTISLKELQIKHFPSICDEMFQNASVQLSALGNAVYEEILAGHKIIGFNGLSSQSGCSIILLGLAGEMLSRGLSVLLIDGNFENPSLASLLDINVQTGWEQAVLNHQSLDSDLIKIKIAVNSDETVLSTSCLPRISNLDNAFLYLLPLSKGTVLKAIKASYHPDLNKMIHQISDQFDLILWDSGCSDVSIQEKISEMKRFREDGYYLVQDIRLNNQRHIQQLVTESSRSNIPCLGIIENFV
ncbi:MAG: hypothetical protein Q4C95_04150 [Planctomycetia bacterium]|nr:hypothetical protein [Planctomycetia bacterium]